MINRTIEPPPTGTLTADAFERIQESVQDESLIALFDRANNDYLYWDKFKYLPMPSDLKPEDAWRFLKVIRKLRRRYTRVKDVHGDTFWYSEVEEVQRCLHVIDQRGGGMMAADSERSGRLQSRYLVSSLMEEAIASSQMEGAATTTRVAKEMLRTGRAPADYSERMIANSYRTIVRIKKLLDRPITPELICDLQASMTEGTLKQPEDAGRFRSTDDDVVVMDANFEILHTPPHADRIRPEIERLCQYANAREPFEHPVMKGVVLHFWLAYLHPFVDGNGRTARALFYLYMLKHKYWLFEYLSISRVLLSKRSRYDKSYLYSEFDDGDMTYFVVFNLHAVVQAIDQLNEYIAKKTAEDERLQEHLKRAPRLNYRQRALLGRALKDSDAVFTIASHSTSHDVVYATARADLLDLVQKGYLIQERVGRRFVFLPAPDLRARLTSV